MVLLLCHVVILLVDGCLYLLPTPLLTMNSTRLSPILGMGYYVMVVVPSSYCFDGGGGCCFTKHLLVFVCLFVGHHVLARRTSKPHRRQADANKLPSTRVTSARTPCGQTRTSSRSKISPPNVWPRNDLGDVFVREVPNNLGKGREGVHLLPAAALCRSVGVYMQRKNVLRSSEQKAKQGIIPRQ